MLYKHGLFPFYTTYLLEAGFFGQFAMMLIRHRNEDLLMHDQRYSWNYVKITTTQTNPILYYVCGRFDQVHACFGDLSRGRQCSFMSFSALLCAQVHPV